MADKLSAREIRAKIEREVIAHEELPRRYGYTLNVSNKTLTVIYNDFKQRYGIIGAPSDKQRLMWETEVKVLLCRQFRQVYKYRLMAPVIGHREEQLEELVRTLDIPSFEEDLFRALDKKIRCCEATQQRI